MSTPSADLHSYRGAYPVKTKSIIAGRYSRDIEVFGGIFSDGDRPSSGGSGERRTRGCGILRVAEHRRRVMVVAMRSRAAGAMRSKPTCRDQPTGGLGRPCRSIALGLPLCIIPCIV